MATAAPELSIARLWPAALLWVAAGGWAIERLPPDGSSGVWLAALWTTLLAVRWLPWARWGLAAPRMAGLCCPAPLPRISDVGMGWMMGTLWWHAEGCLGASTPAAWGVALHLLGMGLLALGAQRWPASWQRGFAAGAWALLALLPWLQAGLPVLWLCMGLLTLAWACEPTGELPLPRNLQRAGLLLCGPLGLWLIHLRWPVLGPEALLQPLAGLALAACVFRALRGPGWPARVLNSGGSA